MQAGADSRDQPKRGSYWRGVLLLVIACLLFGLGQASVVIGLAALALVLDRTAPKRLDELIDFLTF